MNELKRQLERVEIPGEHEARVRSWELVRAAFAERERTPWPRRRARPLLALAAGLALLAAALTPPGRAVIDEVREAIGVERAAPALFSLPTSGRLLVVSDSGPWVVAEDGSKRLLGDYREASWSPFCRFVVVGRENELATVEPGGRVRWSLARPNVSRVRWGGSRTDTRIAYLSGGGLRVVAGDGEPDRLLRRAIEPAAAPAWRPGPRHEVAFVDGGRNVAVADADSLRVVWRRRVGDTVPFHLEWSSDGTRLLVVASSWIAVLDGGGRRIGYRDLNARAVTAALAPRGHTFALVQKQSAEAPSTVVLLSADRLEARPRRVFMGSGFFNGLSWSPNGRWLLVAWPTADQWLFIRVSGGRRLEAVSDVRRQFGGGRFPLIDRWCSP